MAKFILSAFADEAGNTLEEQIAALKKNDIDYIEPRRIDGKGIQEFSEDDFHKLKKELDKNNIKVNSIGSPIGKYNISDDFEPHLELLKKLLRGCQILDTKFIRMFSFFSSQENLAENRDEVIRRLRLMVEEAKKFGVTLCHENESAIYGQMPEEVKDILTNVPELGGIFDPANYRMNDADVMAGIEATLINFKYMHIKDAIYESQIIVPAGEGEGRIGEIIDIVNEKTDDVVYLTLEPHLFLFDAYKLIDEHALKGKYTFKDNKESFDCAVNALKNLLKEHGYERNGNNEWIK